MRQMGQSLQMEIQIIAQTIQTAVPIPFILGTIRCQFRHSWLTGWARAPLADSQGIHSGFQTTDDAYVTLSEVIGVVPSYTYQLSAYYLSCGYGINYGYESPCTIAFCTDKSCGACDANRNCNNPEFSDYSSEYTYYSYSFSTTSTQTTSDISVTMSCSGGYDTEVYGAWFYDFIDSFQLVGVEPVCPAFVC